MNRLSKTLLEALTRQRRQQLPCFLLASLNRSSENVAVFSVIIPELEFGNVQMQILLANVVIGANNPALQDRPEAFNRIGVNRAV